MPEIDDDIDFDSDEPSGNAMKQVRQALKAANRREKELEAQMAALKAQADRATVLERQAAFAKAGVPDEGLGSYFQKGYDGEITVEAIKAAYAEATGKVVDATGSQPHDDPRGAEMAAADRMSSASGGAPDLSREAAYEHERAAAKSPAEVIAVLEKYGKLANQAE